MEVKFFFAELLTLRQKTLEYVSSRRTLIFDGQKNRKKVVDETKVRCIMIGSGERNATDEFRRSLTV